MSAYLESSFLNRVRQAYRSALPAGSEVSGPMWSPINARRADIHAALLDERRDALREIFANPTTTDLYYGCDQLCCSRSAPISPEHFLEAALSSGRARYAADQAKRLAKLLEETSIRSVIEIGPGMGRAAFFSYREGITDYSTIDLPLGVVAQACFLGRALGPDKLWFAGEARELASGRIKLFFTGQKPSGKYGLALNVDSMTEMPRREAFAYARWINGHACLFLSLNHSQNVFSVAELMAFAGLKRMQRSAPFDPEGYGVGVGYREETYLAGKADDSFANLRWQAFRIFTGARARLQHYTKPKRRAVAGEVSGKTESDRVSDGRPHW